MLKTITLDRRVWTVRAEYEGAMRELDWRIHSRTGTEVVKSSPARTVLALKAEHRFFYAKIQHTPTLLDRVRFIPRRSKAKAEWDNLLEAERLGLNAPRAVAYFEERSTGLLGGNCLLVTGLQNTVTLLDFAGNHARGLPAAQKRLFVEGFARFVATLLAARLQHRDPQPANFLYRPETGEFFLVDLADARFKARWSEDDSIDVLSKLCMFYRLYSTGMQRARFWRALGEAAGWQQEAMRRIALAVKERADALNVRLWNSRRRRAFEDNKDFRPVSQDGWTGMARREHGDAAVEVLRAALAGSGELIKDGRATRVVRLRAAGGEWIAKFYKQKTLHGPALDRLRGSRAARCWQAAYDMELRRIPTARPLLYADCVSAGLMRQSVYICEAVRDVPKVYERYCALAGDYRRRREFIRRFARFVRTMHGRFLYHGDMKGDNVFVTGSADAPEFLLIDIDRVAVRARRDDGRAARDIKQLQKEFEKWATPRDRLRFVHAYLGPVVTWRERWIGGFGGTA